MQEENKSPEGNLRDIYYVLFRHIKEMVIFFIVIVAAVTLIMYFVPNFYISTAKLRLKPGRESVILVPTPATGQTMSINQPIGYEINSELEILRSREIAEKVADSVGVKVILNFSDEVAVRDISNIRQTYDARKKNSKESNSTLSFPEELSNSLDLVGELLMRERAARTIMENLVIDIRSSSNIISLSYKARSSKLAYEVLSKFIDGPKSILIKA